MTVSLSPFTEEEAAKVHAFGMDVPELEAGDMIEMRRGEDEFLRMCVRIEPWSKSQSLMRGSTFNLGLSEWLDRGWHVTAHDPKVVRS